MRYAVAMVVDADDFVLGARSRGDRWAADQLARCRSEMESLERVEVSHEPPDSWIVTLAGEDRHTLARQAADLAHEIRDRIRRGTELTATVVIGRPAPVHQARRAATRTADRKLLADGGDRVILPSDDARPGGVPSARPPAKPDRPPARVETTLSACLRRGDRRAAVEVLIHWVGRAAAQPGATPQSLRHGLIAALLSAAEATGAQRLADGSVDWSSVPLTELFELADIHERSYLRLWLDNLIARLIGDHAGPGDPLELAITHIQQHFGDPALSLDSVAGAVAVSPFYISHLFRRRRGETFRHYLTGCRLAYARALLTGTGLPIEQIAARSGYTSAKRFRIVFKRHLGCPPAHYRRQRLH
ncbi:AraC-like DNA-binding protein [Hamadaea flava]|uniref:Helix-turn-helix transcriptional regulator n=1 Tax=Hamadaea flava TaxID=1742688 RepID=A0ABV8LFR5_9ACTN|nr:response regulator transcription factor [Hamadaea flava]MCP2329455.1 AraC-like DNA-binding protein [Hamadaea flava]